MGLRFESKDCPIEEAIFGTQRLRVPQFQRPYSWEEDHCNDLWVDLTDDDSMFVGQFIFNYEFQKIEKFVDVVDGQQRITTILILAAVFRDKAKELGYADVASVIQDTAMVARRDFDGSQFRVKVSPTLSSFFERHVQQDSSPIAPGITWNTDEEKLVIENYLFLRGQLEKFTEGEAPSEQVSTIKRLFKILTEGQVIVTKIFDENDAYEIFESVNATGVELNVADLLKNFLFKKIKSEGGAAAEVSEKWDEMVSNVNDADLDLAKFIRYYWLSKYDFLSEAKLFRAIKSRNFPSWKAFLQELLDSSKALAELRNPLENDFSGTEKPERLKNALVGIRVMNITQCYVFLLSVYRNRERIKTNWLNVFEAIEKFNFLYHTAAKLPANKVERAYQEYASRVEKILVEEEGEEDVRVGIETVFNNLRSKLLGLVPAEEIFSAGFVEITYKKRDLCRYVLSRIEDSLGITSGEYALNHSTLTIEHILPQKPGKDWGLSQADIKSYVHNIGNLTLLGKKPNGTVQNKSIKDKAKLLKGATEIKMTLDLLEKIEGHGTWNEETIQKRARELAKTAYEKVWRIK